MSNISEDTRSPMFIRKVNFLVFVPFHQISHDLRKCFSLFFIKLKYELVNSTNIQTALGFVF